jgi:hypothetical protein
MNHYGSCTQPPEENDPGAAELKPRRGERRKVRSPGLTYISTVGWICRRECCRRSDDHMDDGYPECSLSGGVDEHS